MIDDAFKAKLKKLNGMHGTTNSGHHFIIEVFGSRGIRVIYREQQTELDIEEVSEFINKYLDADIESINYGELTKEQREKELTAYNKFLLENPES